MLGDVVKHLTPDRAFEEYYGKLHAMMNKILTNIEDFASIFSMVLNKKKKQFNSILFDFL
jgi:hypothetical protein